MTSPSSDEQTYLDAVRHEDNLINHRLTWLIASQSLLFTGYAIFAATQQGAAAPHASRWLPLVGLSVAACIWVAILGAVLASWILRIGWPFCQLRLSLARHDTP